MRQKTKPMIFCELSHVEKAVLSMNAEELKKHKEEIMKDSDTIKTKFGNIVLIKHPKRACDYKNHKPKRFKLNWIWFLIGLLLMSLCSCADTRHMVKRCDKMEQGQPSDTVYQAKGNIYIIK